MVASYKVEESGFIAHPQTIINITCPRNSTITMHTPLRMNDDGFEDIGIEMVSYSNNTGKREWTLPVAQHQVRTYLGGYDGLTESSCQTIDIKDDYDFVPPSDYSVLGRMARTSFADINGDGMHDLTTILYVDMSHGSVYIPEVGPTPYLAIAFFFHLNDNGKISSIPRWTCQYTYISGGLWPPVCVGDFDGDGLDDLALGLWGTSYRNPYGYWWNVTPSLMIVHGRGITDLSRPVKIVGGSVLYANYTAYDFAINERELGDAPHSIRMTLDPSCANASFGFIYRNASNRNIRQFVTYDSRFASLISSTADRVVDEVHNAVWLHFRIIIGWDWPHEEQCDIEVSCFRDDILYSRILQEDAFRVENDLDFSGPLSVSAERQGPLAENGWLAAGERLTVSGPRVVYEGTTDVYPPSGICDVVLKDDDGDFVKAPLASGEPINLGIAADGATDLDENLTLALQTLPGTARQAHIPQFPLRVDGELPRLRNPVPGPDEWNTESHVLVGITADDRPTSGVDAASIEYQLSLPGPGHYGLWTRLGIETDPDGTVVGAMTFLDLPDGDDYYIRWRAKDLVNDAYAYSGDCRIMVDTRNVSFSDPLPDWEKWQSTLLVMVGVTIMDHYGSGIDVDSIALRVSHHNIMSYSDWVDWEGVQLPNPRLAEVRANAYFAETPFNYFQWRAMDDAGNGYSVSPHYRVQVDVTPISFRDFWPTEVQNSTTVRCSVIPYDPGQGSGVDDGSIEYRTRSGAAHHSEWARWETLDEDASGRMYFPLTGLVEGADNLVQFRGIDVAGNGPAESPEFRVSVDIYGPEFLLVTPPSGERQPWPSVTFTIVIRDAIVGVDITQVRYRSGTNGQPSIGEWSRMPVERMSEGTYKGTVVIDLARGLANVVQFRAVDMVGHANESAIVYVPVNLLPIPHISRPLDGTEHEKGREMRFSAAGSTDPDGDALNYSWLVDGATVPIASGSEASAILPAGAHDITLVVTDAMGGEARHTVRVSVVEPTSPGWREQGPVMAGLIILIVILLVLVVMMRKRAKGTTTVAVGCITDAGQ